MHSFCFNYMLSQGSGVTPLCLHPSLRSRMCFCGMGRRSASRGSRCVKVGVWWKCPLPVAVRLLRRRVFMFCSPSPLFLLLTLFSPQAYQQVKIPLRLRTTGITHNTLNPPLKGRRRLRVSDCGSDSFSPLCSNG